MSVGLAWDSYMGSHTIDNKSLLVGICLYFKNALLVCGQIDVKSDTFGIHLTVSSTHFLITNVPFSTQTKLANVWGSNTP